MAVGMAPAVANDVLDAVGNNGALSTIPITTAFVQLHTADPGAAGATAVAGNATRKSVSFAAAASGSMASDADTTWTTGEVDTSEDYTHFSLWDASTAGNFMWSGTVTADPVTAGNEFRFPSGSFTLGIGVAS